MIADTGREVSNQAKMTLLFGGVAKQITWYIFIFTTTVGWIFIPQIDLSSVVYFNGPLESAQGSVVEVTPTGVTEEGLKNYRYDYSFLIQDKVYTGSSYDTGSKLPVGTQVKVEFPAGRPSISRIQGMRRNVIALANVYIIIFPLLGLFLVFCGLRSGFRSIQLVRYGLLAKGRCTDKRPTNRMVNSQPIYDLYFEFKSLDGNVRLTKVRAANFEKYEKGGDFDILYSPEDPNDAVLLELIEGNFTFDLSGRTVSSTGSNAVITLPILALVQNLYFLSLHL